MTPTGTLVLTRNQVAQLLSVGECIGAVERAFRMHGEGRASPPGILGIHVHGGGFHFKAGLLDDGGSYFAGKLNANFPGNGTRHGLPTIQGVLLLCDGENGYPLALMDSIEITIRRTGAASAVAAKYLARNESRVITIIGCGNQGRSQLQSMLHVRPLEQAFVHDIDPAKADKLAAEFSGVLSIRPIGAGELRDAVLQSDICVTCTPSRQPLLSVGDVAPGTFVAGVGADSEGKQELDPQLLAASTVVADIAEQSATIGDLQHAIKQGVLGISDVYAELGKIVSGATPGRRSRDEIIVFDSTGMALQDVATAILVYRKARAAGIGTTLALN
jgi:alanine dehydrogenase